MDKLYTIQEVATKLNLSDKTLRRWEDAGRFSSSRTLGNQRRYSIEDLQILDAIKHGTINEQKDLLTIGQASKICGVSPTTVLRWEESGKIHPFITSGNTYYIRQKLIEKMDELKKIYIEPEPLTMPHPPSLNPVQTQPISTKIEENDVSHRQTVSKVDAPNSQLKLSPLSTTSKHSYIPLHSESSPYSLQGTILNALITIILILSYHLIINASSSKPISPQTGSVQGASTYADPTIDLLKTILDPSGALTTTMLTSRIGVTSPTLILSPSSAPNIPTPGTIYYDATTNSLKIFKGTGWFDLAPTTNLKIDDVTLITSSATLPKGKNQISLTDDRITPTTPITITFSSDYAPAKKYWITTDQGSFTVHTDFPVGADSTFNYSLLTPSQIAPPPATGSPILTNPQVKL